MKNPVYLTIKAEIKEKIEQRIWVPGERIPTEASLTETFDASRGTIRKVIDELVNEGILVKKNSIGTFISYPRIEKGLSKLSGFSEDIRSRGGVPSSRILSKEVIEASELITEKLDLLPKEKVVEIVRVRYDEKLPIAWETVVIPLKFCPNLLEEDLENMSLYDFLEERYRLEIVNAVQSIAPDYAIKEDVIYLDVDPKDLMLLSERTTYLSNQNPIEFTTTRYHADRYKFMVTLNR